jgi:hypothetical protein
MGEIISHFVHKDDCIVFSFSFHNVWSGDCLNKNICYCMTQHMTSSCFPYASFKAKALIGIRKCADIIEDF